MSDNKSFNDRRDESTREVVAFWGSLKGLITAGAIIVLVIGTLIWSAVSDLLS